MDVGRPRPEIPTRQRASLVEPARRHSGGPASVLPFIVSEPRRWNRKPPRTASPLAGWAAVSCFSTRHAASVSPSPCSSSPCWLEPGPRARRWPRSASGCSRRRRRRWASTARSPSASTPAPPPSPSPYSRSRGARSRSPSPSATTPGGVRVDEIGGWVGLGWSLEAGGVITRTVRGIQDELPKGYYHTGGAFDDEAAWLSPPATLLEDVAEEDVDGEPDQFFFNFAGRSGRFALAPEDGSGPVAHAIPYQKLDIRPVNLDGPDGITGWVVVAEDGTRYTFAAAEVTTDYNRTWPEGGEPARFGESYTSAWYLTEIQAPASEDRITLEYEPYTARHELRTYEESVHFQSGACALPQEKEVLNRYELAGAAAPADHLGPPRRHVRARPKGGRPLGGASPGHVLDRRPAAGAAPRRHHRLDAVGLAPPHVRPRARLPRQRGGAAAPPRPPHRGGPGRRGPPPLRLRLRRPGAPAPLLGRRRPLGVLQRRLERGGPGSRSSS